MHHPAHSPLGQFRLLPCGHLRRSFSVPARTESMVPSVTWPLPQSDSRTDNVRGYQHVFRSRHPRRASFQRVGLTIIQKGESGPAHNLQLRNHVRTFNCHRLVGPAFADACMLVHQRVYS